MWIRLMSNSKIIVLRLNNLDVVGTYSGIYKYFLIQLSKHDWKILTKCGPNRSNYRSVPKYDLTVKYNILSKLLRKSKFLKRFF